jgi:lysozyme
VVSTDKAGDQARRCDVDASGTSHSRRHNRRLLILAAALTLAVAVSALTWFEWLPRYRPALRRGERYGVDVSAHQGTIDWSKVGRGHIAFAYVKATEGADYTDARFATNWVEARRVGLDVGAYHFFALCSHGSDQARHFLATVGNGPSGLAPAVDLELKGNCSKRPATSLVRRELDDFIAAVEATMHRRVVLYVGHEFAQRYDVPHRALWLRRLYRRPSGSASFWQVQGRARVAGIGGPVDFDVQLGP